MESVGIISITEPTAMAMNMSTVKMALMASSFLWPLPISLGSIVLTIAAAAALSVFGAVLTVFTTL